MNMIDISPVDDRPAISDIVYDRIYGAILDRSLPPSTVLIEQILAEKLGVSKTPVREALLRLRENGLIELEGKRSLRVTQLSIDALRHIMEMREALERWCAGEAARRVNADSIEILEMARGSLAEAKQGSTIGFHYFDKLFHAAITRTIDNPRIQQKIENAVALVRLGIKRETFPSVGELVPCAKRHVLIAEAILAGDAQKAERETMLHIRQVHDLVAIQLRKDLKLV